MQSPGWEVTLCVAWCLIWWIASLGKSRATALHDTECPYGMSQNVPVVIKQHKPNTNKLSLEAPSTNNVIYSPNTFHWALSRSRTASISVSFTSPETGNKSHPATDCWTFVLHSYQVHQSWFYRLTNGSVTRCDHQIQSLKSLNVHQIQFKES